MDLFRPKDEPNANLRLILEEIQSLRVEISQKLDDLKSEIELFKKDDLEISKSDSIMEPSEYSTERGKLIQRRTNMEGDFDEHKHIPSTETAHDVDSVQKHRSDILSIPDSNLDEIESEKNTPELVHEDYSDLPERDALETEPTNSFQDDQQNHLPPEKIQTMDSEHDVAMIGTSDKCMFGICISKTIDLYVQDSQFHLYTSYFKPTLPEIPTCKRAFIFTSMPYTKTNVQMIIIRKLMEHFQFNFRSFVFWNWHAHAKIKHHDAKDWTERMSDFLKTLTPTDELIIQAPYKDDRAAKEICETSVVIHEIRPLEDTALLRFHRYQDSRKFGTNEDATLTEITVAGAVNYVRSMLLHQRYWEKEADVIFSHRKFNEDYGLSFARLICLDYMTEQRIDLCTDQFLSTILSSDEVKQSTNDMYAHNLFLSNLYEIIDLKKDEEDDSTQIMNQIQNIFLPWIKSKIASDLL